jgi:hypothetical protein
MQAELPPFRVGGTVAPVETRGDGSRIKAFGDAVY